MTPKRCRCLAKDLAELEKAADILHYSFDKCRQIDVTAGLDNNDALESFEALSSRFARLSDMLIQKVFRTMDMVELEDAGTVRVNMDCRALAVSEIHLTHF